MAKTLDLNSPVRTAGVFWQPEHPEKKFSGYLTSDRRKLQLLVAAEYSKLDPSTLFRRTTGSETPDLLHGFTSLGPCTLVGLYDTGDLGVQDFTHGRAISAPSFRVSACVTGVQLGATSTLELRNAQFRYRGLEGWFPTPGERSVTRESMSIVYPTRVPPIVDFSVLSNRVRVKIGMELTLKSRLSVTESVVTEPVIAIEPTEPTSFEWLFDAAVRLENFFSLCLGTSVGLRAMSVDHTNGTSGWVIRPRGSKSQKSDVRVWIRCDASQLSSAIAAWLDKPAVFRLVENLVYGTVRHSSMFVETEFLSLAQAVESLHRVTDRTGGRERSFRKRIEDLLARLDGRTVAKVIGDRAVFEQTLRETRNYFTHPGIRKRARVITDPKELFLFNQRLHAWLRLLMLVDLAFPEALAIEPVCQQLQRWE
jgi:hypothetical protein